MKNPNYKNVIFLDIQNAYNSVNINILIKELFKYKEIP